MQSIFDFMSADHARCDDYFSVAELSASEGNWDKANLEFNRFTEAVDHHLRMEEQVLFPQFERATGNAGGPSAVMRMEHTQIRDQLQSMSLSLNQKDKEGFLGAAETLLILMQQHNMKEEQILYPMVDRLLAGSAENIIAAMKDVA